MGLLGNSFFIGLFAYWVIGLFSPSASAQTMSNDNYILQLRDLDTTTAKPTGNESVIGVNDQQASKPIPGYIIQAGFLNHKSKSPFAFSLSETLIYFGPLSPTNPIARTSKLSISSASANGYSVIAFEDRELSAAAKSDLAAVASDATSGAIIPDTSCDNGLCSETISAPWTNPLTYGFGYRCDNIAGSDCLADFSDSTLYKQFANNSKNEMPETILSGTNERQENISQITYKVNISGAQPKGSYQNVITYIAVPNF
jgi:hypothetical protein